jgi:hypothetical protein
MSNIIVVETFYFGDVPWFLSNQAAVTTLLWFFLPLPFMTPFEAIYNLRTTPNIPL